MTASAKILELVARFDRNIDAYKQGKYNEAQVRKEFIDPFFKELGWDVDNEKGYAEAYKDVVHEDAIRVGRATKAPDYSFRIGGSRKFFLEAKKPSVYIKKDIHPAYQLRRYAWSAGLPLSILTDFEEFPKLRDGFYEPRYVYFKDFPRRTINLNDKLNNARHDQMVTLIESMLELHKQLAEAKTVLQRQIEATDRLVYELYDLTEEEIKIVES